MPGYAELAVTSNFSFLRGASDPEELVLKAKELGLAGIGIADRNSVAGVVRAHAAQREWQAEDKEEGRPSSPFKVVVGARLVFNDETPDILAYPQDRAAWGCLMRLLSRGKLRAEKGECSLSLPDLLDFIAGLNLIVLPDRIDAVALGQLLTRLGKAASPGALWLGGSILYNGDDARRLAQLAEIARDHVVPLIAVNDALYHAPERRELQDVVTCIREHVTIDIAGKRLAANAERHLKPSQEMTRLFRKYPDAVAQTARFLDRCRFSLDELRKTEYPEETRKGYATPQEALVAFAEEGARRRFPNGMSPKVRHALNEELRIIGELEYAPFFLTVHDIVNFARSDGVNILCQGRGSAANSVICYCLGVTEVNPDTADLLFERFVSAERREPPDIDVDFEHERREEVIQYIYETYTRERAGLAATVICYRGRSAIRDVGKVFGLSDDMIGKLAGTLWGWSIKGVGHDEARRAGFDTSDPRLERVLTLAKELIGAPRHLSQHVGGFVITRSRLDEVVPIENAAMEDRTVIEWDKNDLETLGLLKVDVLGLGMLSCLRRSFALLRDHYGVARDLSIQDEDPDVYRMIQRADTLGVFQIESRAQMSMLPRLRPEKFYDLVIEVAIVRPGPIQGKMVHPYLKRRANPGLVSYPSPSPDYGDPNELRDVLHRTLGVPLFQEQAMRIAIVAAKFEPGEADRLRRAMATFKRVGTIHSFEKKFIEGMTKRGYALAFAESCFRQIQGFGEYGFPESHAASFANLVYVSSWLKCRYPDVFAAALLNSQPMGFYAPAQIVRDAQDHGVEVRDVDINASHWDCTLETGSEAGQRLHPRHASMKDAIRASHALRLGFRQVAGFSQAHGETIAQARGGGFDSVRDLWLRTGLPPAALERLAAADAFRSLGLDRRDALWAVRALRRAGDKDDLPLFARVAMPELEPDADLPPMPPGQQVVEDYRHLHLSLKAHPVSFLRAEFDRRGILRHERLPHTRSGQRVTVGGVVLVRQRPGTAKNVTFMTMEDETGIANIIIWPRVFETFRPQVLGARLVSVTGALQNEQGVIHVVADNIEDLTPMLRRLSEDPVPAEAAGEVVAVMPKGRNFH
ncbi:MAG: error-prone DNA polymerase [Xanthobacteraceae bacterium]|uniref:error-prone DNA polymerase n=1 Tax=Pseudolabrys sp. TaxID=1960880 RepID=UPI003D15335B